MPAVSVLIPTHDRPERLRLAILSVLKNDFDDFEIVISDDSESGSGESVARTFNDTRIFYHRKPLPSSKPANWSCAARHATGRYLFKLDDDDRIRPGFLRRGYEWMETHPHVGSLYTAYVTLDERKQTSINQIDNSFFSNREIVSGEAYARGVLTNEGGYPRNHKTASFYRRELGERLGWYDAVSEDFAFTVGLALQADVAYLPEILFESVLHESNGVHAIQQSAALSRSALEGLRTHELVQSRPDRVFWENQIDQCLQALSLFYLQYTFREQGRRAGKEYLQQLKTKGPLHPKAKLIACYGSLLPQGLQQFIWNTYQSSPKIQHWIRKMLLEES